MHIIVAKDGFWAILFNFDFDWDFCLKYSFLQEEPSDKKWSFNRALLKSSDYNRPEALPEDRPGTNPLRIVPGLDKMLVVIGRFQA